MDKKLLEKYNRKWKKATLMDDLKFREVAKSKEAIEEILRVVLNDDKLVSHMYYNIYTMLGG